MAGMPAARDEPDVVAVLRTNAERVHRIASRLGLSNVRVASTGRVVVDVAEGGNYDTLADFDEAVAAELGVRVDAQPAEVLDQPGHSRDLDDTVAV